MDLLYLHLLVLTFYQRLIEIFIANRLQCLELLCSWVTCKELKLHPNILKKFANPIKKEGDIGNRVIKLSISVFLCSKRQASYDSRNLKNDFMILTGVGFFYLFLFLWFFSHHGLGSNVIKR